MPDTSSNGVYFDTKNNKVVESPPEEGVQLVAPGEEMTDANKATVDRWRETEGGTVAAESTVTTESTTRKK